LNKSPSEVTVFDQFAQEYDQWFDANPHAYQSELEAVRRFIPSEGGGVEIGVGTGRFSVPFGITIGVEPSAAMAAIARSRGVEVRQAKAEKLPLADATFDFALLVNVICFVTDPLASVKEAHRILKPSGHLILALIDKETELGRKYESMKVANNFYNQAAFFSTQEVIELLQNAGFYATQACQTIFTSPDEMTAPDPVREGYGQGGFVVLNALKRETYDENSFAD
jgi:SAM-dependent methyltransferase